MRTAIGPLRPELAAVLGGYLRAQFAMGVPDSRLKVAVRVRCCTSVLSAAPFLARPGTVLASCGRLVELVVRCLARAALTTFLA